MIADGLHHANDETQWEGMALLHHGDHHLQFASYVLTNLKMGISEEKEEEASTDSSLVAASPATESPTKTMASASKRKCTPPLATGSNRSTKRRSNRVQGSGASSVTGSRSILGSEDELDFDNSKKKKMPMVKDAMNKGKKKGTPKKPSTKKGMKKKHKKKHKKKGDDYSEDCRFLSSESENEWVSPPPTNHGKEVKKGEGPPSKKVEGPPSTIEVTVKTEPSPDEVVVKKEPVEEMDSEEPMEEVDPDGSDESDDDNYTVGSKLSIPDYEMKADEISINEMAFAANGGDVGDLGIGSDHSEHSDYSERSEHSVSSEKCFCSNGSSADFNEGNELADEDNDSVEGVKVRVEEHSVVDLCDSDDGSVTSPEDGSGSIVVNLPDNILGFDVPGIKVEFPDDVVNMHTQESWFQTAQNIQVLIKKSQQIVVGDLTEYSKHITRNVPQHESVHRIGIAALGCMRNLFGFKVARGKLPCGKRLKYVEKTCDTILKKPSYYTAVQVEYCTYCKKILLLVRALLVRLKGVPVRAFFKADSMGYEKYCMEGRNCSTPRVWSISFLIENEDRIDAKLGKTLCSGIMFEYAMLLDRILPKLKKAVEKAAYKRREDKRRRYNLVKLDVDNIWPNVSLCHW